jgi:hypothetical protein
MSIDETLDLVLSIVDSRTVSAEPLINFFQLCAVQMRSESPLKFVDCVDKIFLKVDVDQSSSRGRFLLELVEEIKSNSLKILRKYVNVDLDAVIKQLQLTKVSVNIAEPVMSCSKKIAGVNTPTRMKICDILFKSCGVEDAITRLISISTCDSFDFDMWYVSNSCLAQEAVYNPFYATVCGQLCTVRYKFRKSLKLYLRSITKNLKSVPSKVLHIWGRFLGELYSTCRLLPTSYLAIFSSISTLKSDVLLVSCVCFFERKACSLTLDEESSTDIDLRNYCKLLKTKIDTGYLSCLPNISNFSSSYNFMFSNHGN